MNKNNGETILEMANETKISTDIKLITDRERLQFTKSYERDGMKTKRQQKVWCGMQQNHGDRVLCKRRRSQPGLVFGYVLGCTHPEPSGHRAARAGRSQERCVPGHASGIYCPGVALELRN